MSENKNIELRSKILEYALDIENSVNTFLVVNFEIPDHSKSKNFSGKAGISFKNKIDLLYDLDILSKEEHINLEVFMIFRNKFLHDLECSTFQLALKSVDAGIKNRLYKYLDEQVSEPNEKQLEKAYFNLFLKCFKMLVSKYRKRIEKIEQIGFLIDGFIQNYADLQSATHDACDYILKTLEDAELENPKILELSELIGDKCIELGRNAKKSFLDFEEKGNIFKANFNSINLGKIKHDS